MTSEIQITQRAMDYSTQKLAKWGVYALWGLERRLRKFLAKMTSSGSPNGLWTITHENRKNWWFTHFRECLTLKMADLHVGANWLHS
ncbi:hypothetical protein H5410_056499 [Solanum commersonii]|uniref:Uncharacterized protein n=1 Tax=Solanum commersonii TaxID=4109 RepID=A0A9J5WLW3_SOLCO|nr:hypothetical protein H5410_056499 [Solanum commersonii]